MRGLGVTALLLALTGLGLASRPAAAADFYMVYVSTEGDDYWVELIDPATIATDQQGYKTVRAANISSMELWNDDRLVFDCAGNRFRYASSISHLAGGDTMDRFQIQGLNLGDWDTAKSGEIGFLLQDVVCNWSSDRMTGNSVYTAPDFEAAELRLSDRLSEMESEKK